MRSISSRPPSTDRFALRCLGLEVAKVLYVRASYEKPSERARTAAERAHDRAASWGETPERSIQPVPHASAARRSPSGATGQAAPRRSARRLQRPHHNPRATRADVVGQIIRLPSRYYSGPQTLVPCALSRRLEQPLRHTGADNDSNGPGYSFRPGRAAENSADALRGQSARHRFGSTSSSVKRSLARAKRASPPAPSTSNFGGAAYPWAPLDRLSHRIPPASAIGISDSSVVRLVISESRSRAETVSMISCVRAGLAWVCVRDRNFCCTRSQLIGRVG